MSGHGREAVGRYRRDKLHPRGWNGCTGTGYPAWRPQGTRGRRAATPAGGDENRAIVSGKVSAFLGRGECSDATRDLAQSLLARLKKYDRPNARMLGRLERRREAAAKAMEKLQRDLKRRGLPAERKRRIEFQIKKLGEVQAAIEAQITKFSQ